MYAPKRGPKWATNEKTTMIGTILANGSADTSVGPVLTVWTRRQFYQLQPSFFQKEERCGAVELLATTAYWLTTSDLHFK
ncbi:MAG: hypothetical protein A2Z49_01295 [Chloroflexi bacterium RBG_19FT_COMBO_56_12]|nr:MAG: hypothetical protein A2Z49_01295 [Chloroflexi bacterium RBG_19FT_COMBO_56_12]